MAYSVLQVIDFGNAGSASSIVTGSYTLALNSRVMFIAGWAGSTDISTGTTDTNGNTWAKIGTSLLNFNGGGISYSAWECRKVTNAGSTVITTALSSAATQRGIGGMEVSGLDGVAAVQDIQRQGQAAPGAGSNAITTPTLTPTGQPALMFGFFQNQGISGTTVNPMTGGTLRNLPLFASVNAGSTTKVQDTRLTSTSGTATTVSDSSGTGNWISWGIVVSEGVVVLSPLVGQTTPTSGGSGSSDTSANLYTVHAGFRCYAAGVVTALNLYIVGKGSTNTLYLGLYDSNGNLLCSGSVASAAGLNTVAIAGGPTLVYGQTYYGVWQPDSNSFTVAEDGATFNVDQLANTPGVFPNPINFGSFANVNQGRVSFYASGTLSSGAAGKPLGGPSRTQMHYR